jgi:peptide/nickel transport system substrate-binding protein
VEIGAPVSNFDPASHAASTIEAEGKQRLAHLLFDRLVRLDDSGNPQPQLAVSWSHDAESKKWQFSIRPGVKFQDGLPLTLQHVAASLAAVNPYWRVKALGDSLAIETNTPAPGLPAELALDRNSIMRRTEDGTPFGTGPFRLADWEPAHRVVLAANEDYWGGRPYLDTIEITFGRPLRDQLIDFELGKADVVELGMDQMRRAHQEDLSVVFSSPSELMAILFSPGKPDDARLRESLALSIDRATIYNILLQKQGEPAGSLLPGWLSGYAFLFPATPDIGRAKQLTAGVDPLPTLALDYSADDPLARSIAERIALNARDAGLTLRVVGREKADSSAPRSDARLVRVRLISSDPRAALAAMAEWLHEPVAQLRAESAAPDELYDIEKSLLADFHVIPLFHLPEAFALSSRVEDWKMSPEGGWRLESVWLVAGEP